MISSRHSIKLILSGVFGAQPFSLIGLIRLCNLDKLGGFEFILILVIGSDLTSKSSKSILLFFTLFILLHNILSSKKTSFANQGLRPHTSETNVGISGNSIRVSINETISLIGVQYRISYLSKLILELELSAEIHSKISDGPQTPSESIINESLRCSSIQFSRL